MGNSCGCCLSPPPNNNSPNPNLGNESPAIPHPHLSSPHPSVESVVQSISQSPANPHTHLPSPPPSLESAIHSMKFKIGEEDLTHQIELLIQFIENMLLKIKAPLEHGASTSSSGIQLESVASGTRAASNIIDAISREAKELEKSEVAKELGRVALKAVKLVGESHWIFLGFSMAAYALERCVTVSSNLSECNELLEKIVHLAKDVKKLGETLSHDNERLCYAVHAIVEGTILCCEYVTQGKLMRYWLAGVMKTQVEKTAKSIQDITSSLTLTTVADVNRQSSLILSTVSEIERQLTRREVRAPRNLLDFKPEGIAEKVAQVKEMVDLEGSEAAVGVVLWGFGGVGKSTLASAVIQELDIDIDSQGFKFCMVIIDEKMADKTSHIKQLQKDIINDFDGGKLDLRDTKEGRQQVQQVVRNKRCLLFIDNVVDSSYIRELLPSHFLQSERNNDSAEERTDAVQATKEARLRIVITSRQNNFQHLLGTKNLKEYQVNLKEYHVNGLSDPAAKIILRKTILGDGEDERKPNPKFDEEGCISDIAEACKGVPLLLSVFGNYLRVEKDHTIYEEALKALTEGDFDRIADEENLSDKLMYVYHKMTDLEAKEAFLDICTYFHGWGWEIVADVVDSSNLEALRKRGLVKRDDESGNVIVHDILRLMGSKVAKETRITNYSELAAVVEDEHKLKNMKGVALMDNKCLTTIESTHLYAMRHSLRVLKLGDWVVINGLCDGAFTNLRYLYLGDVTACPFTNVSRMVKLKRFYNKSKAGMDLPELPRTLKGIYCEVPYPGCEDFATLPVESLRSLRSFGVGSSKQVKLPEGFKLPASLERLSLTGCRKLPETFSHLTNVEFLDLSRCDFESLPEGFERLARLKYLYMERCPNLRYLSEGFGSLCSLTKLSVKGCTCLETLPADFGRLTALQGLWMGECESLRTLPEDFGGLFSLEKLDISGCISLERLPESFSRLSLQSLAFESLLSLDELPQSIGKMSSLTDLIVKSCNSLTTLPNGFVQLKSLVYLEINKCIKLTALPEDFGQLSSLISMTVKNCPVLKELPDGKDFGQLRSLIGMTVKNCPALKELPDGFQALPALKILLLKMCRNLINLSARFGELNCLEQLYIWNLPLSSLPKGFGNLKRLRTLNIWNGFKLDTLPDDIENMVSLRTLRLDYCPMLDGATMERLVKLQNCPFVYIYKSAKLIERWEEMQNKEEYPIIVCTSKKFKDKVGDDADWQRAARVALLSLNCKELNGTSDELMDRSSIAIDVDTTIAVILLPLHLQFHHQQHLNTVCELGRRRAGSCSGQLQIIVCLRGVELDEQRVSEEEEEESITKALKWLPRGSCAIPVADMRRRFLVKELFFESFSEESKLACFMAYLRVQGNGHVAVGDGETMGEDEISEKLKQNFHKSTDELQECFKILCDSGGGESGRSVQSPNPPEVSMFKMLAQALKKRGIHHFIDCNMKEVHINQLEGKDLYFIVCDLNSLLHTEIQQICKDLQSFNFEGVWIPLSSNEGYGIGTYIRACGYMSLGALLNPMIIQGIKETNTNFILQDKEGKIISRAPLSLVMSWDMKAYPFREFEVQKIISKLYGKSTLEFLLEDMDILDHKGDKVEKQLINNKLIFLYVESPTHKIKMKCEFDQLLQVHKYFNILYIGHSSIMEQTDIESSKKAHEDIIQKIPWLNLSFWDMVKFWYRCKYLSSNFAKKLNFSFTLPKLVKQLYVEKRWLLFLDIDGIITGSGKEVVDVIFQTSEENRYYIDIMMKDELMKSSLEGGKCTRIVQTYFNDEIYNHPCHPQHPLSFTIRQKYTFCDVCYSSFKDEYLDHQRIYRCKDCEWDLCKDCWKLYAKKEVQSMLEL